MNNENPSEKPKRRMSRAKRTKIIQEKRRERILKNPERHNALRKKRVEEYLKSIAFNNESSKTI
jgi:predicted solute-binding protein